MSDATIFGDLAVDLLETAESCLLAADRPAFQEVFVGHGSVPRGCCDVLSVWIGPVVATTVEQFPTPILRELRCGETAISLQLDLKLRRPCFPFLREPPNIWAPVEEITAFSLGLATDARVLYCCVMKAHQAGTLFTQDANTNPPLAYQAVFGQLLPYREGSCAGWDWTIRVGVPVCCED